MLIRNEQSSHKSVNQYNLGHNASFTWAERTTERSRHTNCFSLSSAVLGVMWKFRQTTPLDMCTIESSSWDSNTKYISLMATTHHTVKTFACIYTCTHAQVCDTVYMCTCVHVHMYTCTSRGEQYPSRRNTHSSVAQAPQQQS